MAPFVHGIYYVIEDFRSLQPLLQDSLFLWRRIKVVKCYVVALQIPLSGVLQIFVWSMKTGHLLNQLRGHEGPVHGLIFSPTNVILPSSWDKTVRLWDLFNGKGAVETLTHTHHVLTVVYHPDGRAVRLQHNRWPNSFLGCDRWFADFHHRRLQRYCWRASYD